MNRRDFLKGAVLATAAGVAGVAGIAEAGADERVAGRGSGREVTVANRRYRLDGSERVLVSHDAGATWAVHSNFAPRYAAERMKVDARGQVWVAVRYERHRFALRLSESGASWQTA